MSNGQPCSNFASPHKSIGEHHPTFPIERCPRIVTYGVESKYFPETFCEARLKLFDFVFNFAAQASKKLSDSFQQLLLEMDDPSPPEAALGGHSEAKLPQEAQEPKKPSPEEIARSFLSERQVRVFRPSNVRFDPRKLDVPDDFFEPTANELKTLIQQGAAHVAEMQDKPLLTKKLRDAEKQKRMNRFRRTIIRILFPDRIAVQGTFLPSSTIREVIRFVRAALLDARNVKFHLFVVPPKKKLLDVKKTLWDEQLVPAAVVHIGIDEGPTESSQLLKPYLLEKIEDTPESIAAKNSEVPTPSTTLSHPSSSERKSPKQKVTKKIPKWFKKK